MKKWQYSGKFNAIKLGFRSRLNELLNSPINGADGMVFRLLGGTDLFSMLCCKLSIYRVDGSFDAGLGPVWRCQFFTPSLDLMVDHKTS